MSATNNKSTQQGSTKLMQNGKHQDPIACIEMCFFCFDVLINHLNHEAPPKNPCFTNDPFPIFVSWHLGKNKRDERLRGCIGTFKATNLHHGLREYAIQSATQDERFQPIRREEVNNLRVSVSILTNFEEGTDFLDWIVGLHGIRIDFYCQDGTRKSATYLPEVASEAGWNKIQTIDELLRKGGYRGPITAELRRSICLTRYQSEKITVNFNDYQSWRKSVA